MSDLILERAEKFIWHNARLLERMRFAFHFQAGLPNKVVDAVKAFQNEDGGFGNALEPDIRCPDSQPVPTQHALEFIDEVGFDEEIAKLACDYLLTITTEEGGVPWLLPTALRYPRAPWWNTEENPPASLNPTAAIAGVMHKNNYRHEWLELATNYCWSKIAKLEPKEMHETGVALKFLYHVPDRERADKELARLIEPMFLAGLVADVEDRGYVWKPLDWAPTPEHPLRTYFEKAVIDEHIEQVLQEQLPDGGWTIPWPPVSPSCLQEWRGWVTLEKLLMLESNGLLE